MKWIHFEDEVSLGEHFHKELVENFALETECWATERVERAERLLNFYRLPKAGLKAEILWLADPTAFTAPGRYVYLSRELLQRAATDEPVAFVLAHEMAHHDLGHMDRFMGPESVLRHIPVGGGIASLLRAAEWLLIQPEAEADADQYALNLCRRAGFNGRECLKLFDILESYAIDHHALDAVFGTDESLEEETQAVRHWASRLKEWGTRRMHRYPPIRERKESLLKRLA